MLAVSNMEVVYSDAVLALRGVSFVVPDGRIVALLGANGAGKTTAIRAVTGLLGAHAGAVTKGRVTWDERDITDVEPSRRVRAGISQVMEGRRIFGEMTVDENLRAGAFTVGSRAASEALDRVVTLFPRLAERRHAIAGNLSGGEQQMLAIGRALMQRPRLLILDEPSLGLAPMLVRQMRDVIVEINQQGVSVLLIEQNAKMALSIAHTGYVLETGRIVMEGSADTLLADDEVREFYLGLRGDERRSFRDLGRHRERWGS